MITNMLKKVLLVDDDSVTLSLCDMVIKRFTFAEEVDKAQNGQEAIDYFNDIVDDSNNSNTDVPAVIFLDLNMPVMNGWDFLDEFIRKGFNKLFPILASLFYHRVSTQEIFRERVITTSLSSLSASLLP
jgi:CheY-like chemotaxis protein